MTRTRPVELTVLPSQPPSHCQPASTGIAPANVRGEQANRLMVIFRAPGCAYDLRDGGGCTYCGFRHLTTNGEPVTTAEYTAQFEHALKGHHLDRENVRQIDLFNSGSFLNDDEVPADARRAILRRCRNLGGVRVVMAESRPEYITAAVLGDMQEALRGSRIALEIGIGFDAFDESKVRAIRKGITRASFESAVARMGESGTDVMTYVLLKPCEMSDDEALADVQNAARYVHSVAARHGIKARISLEPTFVVPDTPLAAEFRAGRYVPPSFALVVEAAARIAPLGPLTVGLWDEGLNPLAVPYAPARNLPAILDALRRFNLTQDPSALKCV